MAQQIGVQAALAKDLGSLATTCDPAPRDLTPSSGLDRYLFTGSTDTCTCKHLYT